MADAVKDKAQSNVASNATDVSALVDKYAYDIDRLLDMPQPEQERFFLEHGIDPAKLMTEHYPDLVERSQKLTKENNEIYRRSGNIARVTFLGSVAGLTMIPKKYFTNKNWVKALGVGFFSLATSITTYLGVTRYLSRDIRVSQIKSAFSGAEHPAPKESELLALEAREAMRRELAVILENDAINHRTSMVLAQADAKDAGKAKAPQEAGESFASKVTKSEPKQAPVPAASHVEQLQNQETAMMGTAVR